MALLLHLFLFLPVDEVKELPINSLELRVCWKLQWKNANTPPHSRVNMLQPSSSSNDKYQRGRRRGGQGNKKWAKKLKMIWTLETIYKDLSSFFSSFCSNIIGHSCNEWVSSSWWRRRNLLIKSSGLPLLDKCCKFPSLSVSPWHKLCN